MTGVLPCLIPAEAEPRTPPGRLGDPLLDVYLGFVAARSRPNTVLATWFDLKVFFTVVGKPVGEVAPVDVLGFITAQRAGLSSPPDPHLVPAPVPMEGSGVSLRTIRRRLSTIGGLYAFLTVRGDVPANPVPRGLPTRRKRSRPAQGVPLVRAPRTLPRILSAGEVDALTTALRTHRDRETNYQRTLTRVLGLTAPGSADGEFCWMKSSPGQKECLRARCCPVLGQRHTHLTPRRGRGPPPRRPRGGRRSPAPGPCPACWTGRRRRCRSSPGRRR